MYLKKMETLKSQIFAKKYGNLERVATILYVLDYMSAAGQISMNFK